MGIKYENLVETKGFRQMNTSHKHYSYIISKKNNFTKIRVYLPDSSMSASSSHSWKARLSSFLFFTHSSSGSVSRSAAGPLYQSPAHPLKKEKINLRGESSSNNHITNHYFFHSFLVQQIHDHRTQTPQVAYLHSNINIEL